MNFTNVLIQENCINFLRSVILLYICYFKYVALKCKIRRIISINVATISEELDFEKPFKKLKMFLVKEVLDDNNKN